MSTSPSSVLSAPSVVSSTRSRKLFVLIHGILTKSTAPAWIDRLAHYLWLMEPGCETVKRRYTAGPFPIWNVFVKNHILARALAEELRPYCEDGAELHFVTHSNGADIALKTIRRLAQEGHKTNVAIFIGAALRSDIEASGLYELLELGAIRAAFAYCSSSDLALRLHATWPYGHLGRLGFHHNGEPSPLVTARGGTTFALTRQFAGYGHGGYFAPQNEPSVFSQIREDLNAAA